MATVYRRGICVLDLCMGGGGLDYSLAVNGWAD